MTGLEPERWTTMDQNPATNLPRGFGFGAFQAPHRGIGAGPLFRSFNRHGQVQPGRLSGIDVARVVKKLAQRAGLDAAMYAGHSLRAGHATSAAIAGASERSIMNQTGHRSVQMVRRYIREGSLFRENSAGKLGL